MKRGQVALFVLLGLVLVLALFLVFYFSQEESHEALVKEIPAQFSALHTSLQSCLDATVYQGITLLAHMGGHFPFIGPSQGAVSYYYKNGEYFIPDLGDLEKSLARYLTLEMPLCFDFLDYTFQKEGNLTISFVSLRADSVKVVIKKPFVVGTEGLTTSFDTFTVVVHTSLSSLRDISENLVQDMIVDSSLCVTCVSDIADTSEFYIAVQEMDDTVFFVSVIDDSDMYLRYQFLVGLSEGGDTDEETL